MRNQDGDKDGMMKIVVDWYWWRYDGSKDGLERGWDEHANALSQ